MQFYLFLKKVIINPAIKIAPLIINGVHVALLTIISIPNKLKPSESCMACMPKTIVPIRPKIKRINPVAFIMIWYCV